MTARRADSPARGPRHPVQARRREPMRVPCRTGGADAGTADDAEVQPWVAAVRQEAEEESSLTDYLPSVLFVVRDAIHHLRKVYQRLKRE